MNKEKKNLLVFGYGLAVISSFWGILLGLKHGWGAVSLFLLIMASGFAIETAIDVFLLKPFYKKWMKVAHFIGNIIAGITLSILFYGIFGPVGIILRLLKKDLLERTLDNSCTTYWHSREEKKFDKKHYLRQF